MDQGLFKLFPEDEESTVTPWHSVSGALLSVVQETIKPFEAVPMETYEGRDLTFLKSFEKSLEHGFVDPHARESYGAPPSLDKNEAAHISRLKGNVIKGSISCYSAQKLEKITFVQLELVKKYYGNIITVWPDDAHALPILIISMDENPEATHFFVDCMALADCVTDPSYLKTYLDPFEPAWKKYKFIRDLPNFPAYEVNVYSWMRAIASPYLITRRVPPHKPKGIRGDLIRLGVDYLKIYLDMWEKAKPHEGRYMDSLNQRKAIIRKHFRTGKDPDGNFWWKGERYLDSQLTGALIAAAY